MLNRRPLYPCRVNRLCYVLLLGDKYIETVSCLCFAELLYRCHVNRLCSVLLSCDNYIENCLCFVHVLLCVIKKMSENRSPLSLSHGNIMPPFPRIPPPPTHRRTDSGPTRCRRGREGEGAMAIRSRLGVEESKLHSLPTGSARGGGGLFSPDVKQTSSRSGPV